MAEITQMIATINPDKYYDYGDDKAKLKEFKELIKERGFREASEQAKPKSISEHTLIYESYAETLEPVYYFVLDLMDDLKLSPEKLIDNFSPSPGSTDFGELGTRASAMQKQASEMLVNINAVLRSVMNLLYELKEMTMSIQSYDDLHSKDGSIRNSARLSLKQKWMDKVDMLKGNSSIKAMAMQQGNTFATLIHAFLAANTVKDAEAFDLNDIVKRVLIPRIQEFNHWVEQSEVELRNRFQLEKTYLKAQVNNLKLYSRWAKPYLLAAQKLEQKLSKNAALVNSFNRTILQLTLLGKSELKVKDLAISGELPAEFASDSFIKKLKRKYYSCILVDFVFRAVPQGTKAGGSTYIGRVDIKFRAYSLNEDEIAKLKQEMDKSDMGDVLKLIEGITDDSLKQIQDEINFFMEEKQGEKKEEEESSDESNPFLALIGFYNKPKKSKVVEKEKKEIIVEKDNWIEEQHLRKLATDKAKEQAFNFFDVYKKSHGMPSYT